MRVIQIPVPGRVYGTYINTQLAGDEPPDMMELSPSDEVMARYFVALTPWVEKPNPYNKGTDLENVPWRDTFLDGLSNDPGLNTLLDNYVILPFIVTSRMYYNRDLQQLLRLAGRAGEAVHRHGQLPACLAR